jgi:hypothetical protein
LKQERGFTASDRAADADGERAARKIAGERRVAFMKVTRMIEMFVRVTVRTVIVAVGMRVCMHRRLGLKKSGIKAVVRALPDV